MTLANLADPNRISNAIAGGVTMTADHEPRAAADQRRRRAATLFDQHGAAALTMVRLLTGTDRDATRVLIRVFAKAVTEDQRGRIVQRRSLARDVLLYSEASVPLDRPPSVRLEERVIVPEFAVGTVRGDQRRALLALCMFGAHTYRDAADVLGIEADDAAKQLREALRALSAS